MIDQTATPEPLNSTASTSTRLLCDGHPGTGLYLCQLNDGSVELVDCHEACDDIIRNTGEYADGNKQVVAFYNNQIICA